MLKFSIVTPVRNGADTLADCIESVHGQMLPPHQIEHIIVDGGSTDDTLDIVARANGRIAKVVSEPDRGIYDAMNKGIALATGDVVGILNADDFYAHRQVLGKVAQKFADVSIEACYGDLNYVAAGDTDRVIRFWRSGRLHGQSFLWGWMPPHPTFFVRRSIYEQFGNFNMELGSAADYELMLRFLVKHKIRVAYIPEVMVHMRAGGKSNASLKNRILANRMDRKAWRVNGLQPYPWTLWLKPLRKVRQFRRLES